MKEKAIIIGSGIGGMALSVMLAKENYNTIVLEKNHLLGGRCTSYEKVYQGEKFIVDMWTHTFPTAERVFNKIFEKANIDYGIKFYHFTPDNPPQIWSAKGKMFNIQTSNNDVPQLIKSIQKSQKRRKRNSSSKPANPSKSNSKLTNLMTDIFSLSKKKLKELDKINFEEWIRNDTNNELIIN